MGVSGVERVPLFRKKGQTERDPDPKMFSTHFPKIWRLQRPKFWGLQNRHGMQQTPVTSACVHTCICIYFNAFVYVYAYAYVYVYSYVYVYVCVYVYLKPFLHLHERLKVFVYRPRRQYFLPHILARATDARRSCESRFDGFRASSLVGVLGFACHQVKGF